MTIDQKKKSVKLLVCARHPSAEEHDIFANLALKWVTIALDRESRVAIGLDRFEDDGGAPSVSVTAEGPNF